MPVKTVIRNVILADDDADDLLIFEEMLRAIDPSVKLEVVTDGQELLHLLQNIYPDLLFLDLDMPVKNGLECLVEIRGNERLKNLPVVVFSSTTRPANIQTAYEMGAHLFLIKSPSYQEHLAAVKAILALDWSEPEEIKNQYCVNGRYTAFS